MFDTGWERGADGARSRAWSTEVPSVALTAALEMVEAIDPVDDDGDDAVERIGAWEAVAAWAIAQQVETAVDLLESRQARAGASRRAQADRFAATAMELATMARVAPVTGEHRLHQALALVRRLPGTFEALRAGRIAYSHARVLIEQTQDCDDDAAAAVDARYWGGPGGEGRERTPTQTRERVRRVIQRLDPEALRRRAQAARTGRTVRYWCDDDGATGVITLRLPAEQARGVFAVIDAAAHRAGGPPDTPPEEQRSQGQRRADAAVDLIMNGATTSTDAVEPETAPPDPDELDVDEPAAHGPDTGEREAAGPGADTPPRDPTHPSAPAAAGGACDGSCRGQGSARSGERARVQTQVRVLVPWQTLAGQVDVPAELEGHGPIPAETARRLAAGTDAVLQRLLTDPVTGSARHLDLRRYRPPPSLRALVEDRDQFCHAPGCRRSARACDLDHVIAYDHTTPDGGAGRTHPDGLKPECRRHHNLKTRGLWHCEVHEQSGEPPGVTWTSPSGHTWLVHAPSLTDPDLGAPDPDAVGDEALAAVA